MCLTDHDSLCPASITSVVQLLHGIYVPAGNDLELVAVEAKLEWRPSSPAHMLMH